MKPSMFYIAPIVAVAVFLEGCGIVKEVDVKGYDGPPLAIEQLAGFDNSPWGCIWCLKRMVRMEDGRGKQIFPRDRIESGPWYNMDGSVLNESGHKNRRIGWIMLLPGEYLIAGSYRASKSTRADLTATVTLEAGHKYSFHDQTTVWSHMSNIYLADDTTGEVLAGQKW